MRKIAFYDIEIEKCIPGRYGDRNPKYQYADSWESFDQMGIACIAVYTTWSGYHVFLGNQLLEFQELMTYADEIAGYNSISFDDRLLAANSVNTRTTYDLLREIRIASGQPPHYVPGVTRGGYALENVARANLGRGKTGSGSLAPKLWQEQQYRDVISYCLNDVELLRFLYERRSHLMDPTNGKILCLRGGSRWEWAMAVANRWVKNTKQKWSQANG